MKQIFIFNTKITSVRKIRTSTHYINLSFMGSKFRIHFFLSLCVVLCRLGLSSFDLQTKCFSCITPPHFPFSRCIRSLSDFTTADRSSVLLTVFFQCDNFDINVHSFFNIHEKAPSPCCKEILAPPQLTIKNLLRHYAKKVFCFKIDVKIVRH